MIRLSVVALVCASCGSDVLLGVGDPPSPFQMGAFVLVGFAEPPAITCDGSLAGREAEFDRGRLEIGLFAGNVGLLGSAEGAVEVFGEAILSSFGVGSLTLRPGEGGLPESMYAATLERDLPGPAATVEDLAFFALDSTSVNPAGMSGQAGVGYRAAEPAVGRCTVAYDTILARP